MYHNKTMKAMNKKSVMIITPPLTSPAMPSFTGAFAAGCFLRAHLNPISYDANLDFFVNHVFSKRVLTAGFKAAEQKKEKGLIPCQDFRILEQIFQSLSSKDVSTDFFRSESFYDPEKYLAVRNQIDDFFLLYSAGFYPSRIRWSCMAGSVIEDSHNRLFISFCHEKLDLMLGQNLPEAVLIALDSENQIFGANTIISYIKKKFPEIQTVILQDKDRLGNNTSIAEHIFSLKDQLPFFEWINITWKRKNKYTDVEPDFSLFPLSDYLSPELVLPVQPSFLKDEVVFWNFVARLNDKLGAKGFLFENLMPGSCFDIFLEKKDLPDVFFGIKAMMEDWDKINQKNENQRLFVLGMKMIQWEYSEIKGPLNIKSLWGFSKQGIWNHVQLNGMKDSQLKKESLRFISLNPNIAHSYENLNGKGPYTQTDLNEMDPLLQAYSGVKPIGGEPFWKFLSDPVHLLLYLKHHGKKNFFCLRADRKNETLISLGSNIIFHFRKPADLPKGYLDEICAMVEAGGSVDTTYVRSNLERAYLIGYAMENGIIVGNSSLKHPRQAFIQKLNAVTGLDFNDFVERGYTSVRPEYRALGVGAKLLEGLTKRAGQYKIFSIISEDNTATHKIAQKNKTKKIAVYYSEKLGKDLGVWMPEEMIEKNWKIEL
jgi:GNAT superfamily N-acetyltransferase